MTYKPIELEYINRDLERNVDIDSDVPELVRDIRQTLYLPFGTQFYNMAGDKKREKSWQQMDKERIENEKREIQRRNNFV